MTIDLFVTHTIADSGTTKANNTWYRYKLTTYLLFFKTFLWSYSFSTKNNFSYQIFIKNKDLSSYTTFRVKQVEELMDSFIKNSKADAVILGGDFNTPPLMDPGQPYEIIQRYMNNSCAEFWAKMEEWLLPKFATYGNARNSFSYTYDPITYDYVFHKRLVIKVNEKIHNIFI